MYDPLCTLAKCEWDRLLVYGFWDDHSSIAHNCILLGYDFASMVTGPPHLNKMSCPYFQGSKCWYFEPWPSDAVSYPRRQES